MVWEGCGWGGWSRIIENQLNSMHFDGFGRVVSGADGTRIIENPCNSMELDGFGGGVVEAGGTRIIENRLKSMDLHGLWVGHENPLNSVDLHETGRPRIIENQLNSIHLHGFGGGVGGAAGSRIIENPFSWICLVLEGSEGGASGLRIIENQLGSMDLYVLKGVWVGRAAPESFKIKRFQ